MKKTLAFLIAVLMVVAMLPATVLGAAGAAIADAWEQVTAPEPDEAAPAPSTPDSTPSGTPVVEPTPADTDYFSVYDADGVWVKHFATLAEADAALQNGYTLKILKSITLAEAYTWTKGVAFTIDGNNADMSAPAVVVTGAWVFNAASADVTLKNVAITSADGIAVTVDGSAASTTLSVTFEACAVTGKTAALKTTGVLGANIGASVQIAGTANTFTGETVAIDNGASLSIEGGTFAAATAVTNSGALYVAAGTFTGTANAALEMTAGTAAIGGGSFVLNAEEGTDIAAVKVSGGVLNVLDATLTAINNVALWAAEGLAANSINIYNMTATGATAWCNANVASARSTLAYVAADAVVENAVTVAVATDLSGANGLILNATGKTLAAVAITNDATLGAAMLLVPNGGTLKVLADLDLGTGGVFFFEYMPKINVTLDGASDTSTNALIKTSYDGAGGIHAFDSNAIATLKNVTLENVGAGGLLLVRNAAFGNLIVGSGATLKGVATSGTLVKVHNGNSFTVTEGGKVEATGTAIEMGVGTFTLDGGEVKMPATVKAAVFTSVAAGAKVILKAGTITAPGGPQYLFVPFADATYVPTTEISAGVKFLSAADPGDTNGLVIAENPVELLNTKGEHVAYYASIVDAYNAAESDYTIKLRADHLETKALNFTRSKINIAVDGTNADSADADGRFTVYLASAATGNGDSIYAKATNAEIYLNNILFYNANGGIICNGASSNDVVLNNVFIYAAGTISTDSDMHLIAAERHIIRLFGSRSRLTVLGDKSGGFVITSNSGNGGAIRNNNGILNIYDGTYTYNHVGDKGALLLNQNGAYTIIAGGTFAYTAEDGNRSVIQNYNNPAPTIVITGGTFINKGTGTLASVSANSSANSNNGFGWIFGGKFYTNSANAISCGSSKPTFVNIMGGEFYTVQEVAGTSGISGTAKSTEVTFEPIPSSDDFAAVARTYKQGLHIDYNGNSMELTAPVSYTLDGEADKLAVSYFGAGKTFSKEAVVRKQDATSTLAYKLYAYEGAPAIDFYGDTSIEDLLWAVSKYSIIELQRDIDLADVPMFQSRTLYKYDEITITSAASAVATTKGYYTMEFSIGKSQYRWIMNGGYWIFENVNISDAAGKHLYVLGATIELGDNASLTAYDVPIFLVSSKLIVGKNAWIYKTAKSDGAISGNYVLRANGNSVVDVYGKVGYDRDNKLVLGMTGGAIRLESAGASAVMNIHDGAWVGSSATTDLAQPLITDNRTYNGTPVNNTINIHDGAILQSNYRFVMLNAGVLNVGNVKFYSSNAQGDRISIKIGTNYVFYLLGVSVNITNLTVNLVEGGDNTPFIYLHDNLNTSDTKLTSNFRNNNILGGGTGMMYLYTDNIHVNFYGGSYETLTGNQLISFNTSQSRSGGSVNLYDGVVLRKMNKTNGMLNMAGAQNITVYNARIESDQSTLFSGNETLSGKLTIKDGTFIRDCKLGSLISIPAGAKVDVVIEDGDFSWGTKKISTNAGYDSTFITIMDPDSTLLIKDGNFKLNIDNDPGKKNSGNFYRGIVIGGTAVIENGNFELIAEQASTATLELMSLFRVEGTGSLTVKNGYFKSVGNFLAMFEQRDAAQVVIEAGIFEATDGYLLYSDSYTGATGYGIVVNGGTFTMQSAANSVHATDADAIIGVNTGKVCVVSAILVNNSATSGQIVNKFGLEGMVHLNGGTYLASATQKNFVTTVGSVAPNFSIPDTTMSILPGKTPRVKYLDREYYVFAYKVGNLLAPSVDTIKIRLYEDASTTKMVEGEPVDLDDNGILFISTIPEPIYNALRVQLNNMMEDSNGTINGVQLSYGTLIAPVSNLSATGGVFSEEAFLGDPAVDTDDLPYAKIEAVNGLEAPAANGDLVIRAALVDIAPENYGTLYTAYPYVNVTFTYTHTPAGESTPITTPVSTDTWYPTFNSSGDAVTSISELAQKALYDTMIYPVGEYLYKSTVQPGSYSRYSASQQETLRSFIAHVHEYNYRGECACGDSILANLAVDEAKQLFLERGYTAYYKVTLAEGITYGVKLSDKQLANIALYDADGNACTLNNGEFACTEAGDYYLVVAGKAIGATQLSVSHAHATDYTGYCSICEKSLAVELTPEKSYSASVIRGNKYYYEVELIAGQFTLTTINGLYTIYNAAGEAVAVEGNIFESTGGTYHIEVEATFSATGSVHIKHVHNYGHTGVCSYPGCGSVVTVTVPNVYSSLELSMLQDEYAYFKFTVPTGEGDKVYAVKTNSSFIGRYWIYDAEGTQLSGTLTFAEGESYYVVAQAQDATKLTLSITVAHTHEGADAYNHKGEGQFVYNGNTVSCSEHKVGKTFSLNSTYSTPAVAGQTKYYFNVQVPVSVHYEFTFSENVTWKKLYGDDDGGFATSGTAQSGAYWDEDTGIYYGSDTARTVYIVVEVAPDNTDPIVITSTHVHHYDYTGICHDTNCGHSLQVKLNKNSETAISYTAEQLSYYYVALAEGEEFTVDFTGAEVTWILLDRDGNEVYNSTQGNTYTVGATAQYYLLVTATAASEQDAKLVLSAQVVTPE